MEESISLEDIFELLKKYIVMIIISMFVGLGFSGVITFFIITPKYESQAQLIVKLPQAENSNAQDVNTNLLMINTYKDLIAGDLVTNIVKDRLELEYDIEMTTDELKNAIRVKQSQNSQMFSIVAIDYKAQNAKYIANTMALVFQENVKDVMDVDKISIISDARVSLLPVSPNNKLNLAIGLILGAVIGISLAFLFKLLDYTIRDDRYASENLGFAILGSIPQMDVKDLKQDTNQVTAKPKQDTNKRQSHRSRARV